MAKVGDKAYQSYDMVASGLAAVWAKDNSRREIFDAMARKEVYATTGSRMTVRFFGAWDFEESDANTRLPATIGYAKGVPMGGNLAGKPEGRAPTFLVAARKDPLSGNLDRIQLVKVWVDDSNARHEKVYEAVWAGERNLDANGKLPPIGSTVDVANATWTNTIGNTELIGVWTDPDFDPKHSASYYARVLEIPTPRWMAYEAKRYGLTDLPEDVEMVTQERAYTSPIWYTPKKD
jgi:hypothetical protein